MGRFRRQMEEMKGSEFEADDDYHLAYKKVQRIKGFYIHLMVYILVNVFIFGSSLNWSKFGTSEFLNFWNFSTAFFWGIGLFGHWLSAFGRNIFFSPDWEDRKIKQFMDEEKKRSNQ